MPNVRDKSKQFVAAWVPGTLKRKLKAIAKEQNKSLSELCEEMITSHVETGFPDVLKDSPDVPPVPVEQQTETTYLKRKRRKKP